MNAAQAWLTVIFLHSPHNDNNVCWAFIVALKHTTTLFVLSDHYILSREWTVIVDQVQTNNHGRPMVL